MNTTITLTFRWPMGHRILGLTGGGAKCRNIHGHNWIADVELPNNKGALEFGAVKAAIGGWIDDALDHGFAIHDTDEFLHYLREHNLKHITLDQPPTTEAITALIATKAYELLGVRPVRVHVMEGYRNAATWYNT
jgi:6-pyruvoyltetrahydropterin/6-carboxytetrahydropterin synthase